MHWVYKIWNQDGVVDGMNFLMDKTVDEKKTYGNGIISGTSEKILPKFREASPFLSLRGSVKTIYYTITLSICISRQYTESFPEPNFLLFEPLNCSYCQRISGGNDSRLILSFRLRSNKITKTTTTIKKNPPTTHPTIIPTVLSPELLSGDSTTPKLEQQSLDLYFE